MELIPGASSALYGPNSFNGLLVTTSKSPYQQAGLSAKITAGATKDNTQGTLDAYAGRGYALCLCMEEWNRY